MQYLLKLSAKLLCGVDLVIFVPDLIFLLVQSPLKIACLAKAS